MLALSGSLLARRNGCRTTRVLPPAEHAATAAPRAFPRMLALQGDGWPLYELVTRHFLACCSADAVGATTQVSVDMGGEIFTTSGTMVLERNWYDVFRYQRWSGNTIPQFQPGQTFVPSSLLLRDGTTVPPAPLTEKDLIDCMTENGIGTDATMADHIEKIQERECVLRAVAAASAP